MKAIILEYLKENLEIVGDEAVSILDSYVETLDSHVAQLGTAVEKFDIPAVRTLTHALTGCSGNIGAEEIVRISVELNHAAHSRDREELLAKYRELIAKAEELKNS